MREIESDGETANGQAGAQTSTTGAPWKAGPLGAREQGRGGGYGATWAGGYGAMWSAAVSQGPVCEKHKDSVSVASETLWGALPPEEKNIFAKGREKRKEGEKDAKRKEKRQVRMGVLTSLRKGHLEWMEQVSTVTPPPPQRKSGKITAVSRKARHSRGRGGVCGLTPRLPVAEARRTVLRGAGKGSLLAGSLNPHPISQVPRVKPVKGPWLNHRAATPPVPSANPWGPAAFFSFFFWSRQEDEACSGTSCHLLTNSWLF